MSEWVKVPVGRGNWVRFDSLTDEDMAAVVKRIDTDYLPADLAGRYAAAWLDVARLISTFAAVQSLVALAHEASAGAAPLDVKRLAEAILASVSYEPSASRFVLYEDDGPEVLAERIAAEYARLSEGTDR